MTIEISPETERLVREIVDSGHFHSVDEAIVTVISAWLENAPRSPTPIKLPPPGAPPERKSASCVRA